MHSSSFVANSQHIANFEARPYPEPLAADVVTLAFGNRAYEKIVKHLMSPDPVIQVQAVLGARQLLLSPVGHVQCISAGIIPALVDLLKVSQASLQVEIVRTLQLLIRREGGCRDILQHGGLTDLLELLKQHDTMVKDAVYDTLISAAHYDSCRGAIVQMEGALALLVLMAQQEESTRAAKALDLLVQCTQMRNNETALSTLIAVVKAVPEISQIISNNTTPELVCLKATRLLGVLASAHDTARQQAVECGCVPVLLEQLAAGHSQQACAAAEALMMVTLAREGKVALQEAKGASVLLNYITGWANRQQSAASTAAAATVKAEEACMVNVLQTMANVAEYPPCRTELQQLQAGTLLQSILDQLSGGSVEAELTQRAVEQTLQQINFRSWPH